MTDPSWAEHEQKIADYARSVGKHVDQLAMKTPEHVYYVIRVPIAEPNERVLEGLKRSVARALHHGVKAGIAVAQLPPRPPEFDGLPMVFFGEPVEWKTLDPKGDDSGHHPGHDEPLVDAPDGS